MGTNINLLKGRKTMSEEKKTFGDIIIAILAGMVLLVLGTAAYGHVLSTMWGWFVVPLGVQQISMMHSYGLALLVALAVHRSDVAVKEQPSDVLAALASGFVSCVVKPYIILLIGYAAHYIMVMP